MYNTISIDIWKRKSTVWKQTRGLRLKVRIEKQSKLDEEHAQFNIHEYEFTSMVGRHRNVTAAAIERGNKRSQKI